MDEATIIEAAAQAAHEANKDYCAALGDHSHQTWETAPDWQRNSIINGVKGVLNGKTPEQLHESWLDEKRRTGWKYGPVKDIEKKEHPCFVPYSELPRDQHTKDHIFVAVVRAVCNTLRKIQ